MSIDRQQVLDLCFRIIARFEGLRLRPYLCQAGIPTIGIGATYYRNGVRVRLTDPAITKEEALLLFRWMVETEYLPAVLNLCPGADTVERIAALVDFAFNLGIARLRGSTLRSRVNAHHWGEAYKEMLRWDKVGGAVNRGLVLRRQADAALIMGKG